MKTKVIGLAALALLFASCGDASGSLVVRIGGEEAAESGWPVELDGETLGFEDGWSMQFDRVLVSIVSFSVRGGDGAPLALDVDPVIAELSGGPVEAWREDVVPARRWERVDYRIAPPAAGARVLGGARESDVQRMIAQGWSLLLEGRASHPTHDAVTFSIGLALDIDNTRCELEDGTPGIVVPAGGVADTELTLHLDHLFFDRLGADEPAMRFEAWAAAAGDDGSLTVDDLAAQSLADLRGVDGEPLGVVYDPGSTPLPSSDLRAFVMAAARSVGHLNGEGHCDYD